MTMGKIYVDGISTALPAFGIGQAEAAAFLKAQFGARLRPGSLKLLEKVFAHPSVGARRFAIESPADLVDEDPDRRAERFTRRGTDLAAEAAAAALKKRGLKASDVAALVVNTCTGYICPGLSTYVLERLGLPRGIKCYDLVGSGCGGAVPNLQLAAALSGAAGGRPVLAVSVEICSATFQMGDDASLIVSNAIFGDGAAAAVVSGRPGGFEVIDSASRFATEYREDIRFYHKDGQLHNRLSARLPELAAAEGAVLADGLLKSNGLGRGDVARWAVHPGGENVIGEVQNALALDGGALRQSRRVLREAGNLSSATVWFVLAEMEREGLAAGDLALLLAFGAGLSAHAALLRRV